MDSWVEIEIRLEQLLPLIEEQLAVGKSVKFMPRGVSMLPMLRQGIDSVVLSPVPEKLKKYDLPLYRRNSGQFVLHRIVQVGETYTCIGDNQFVYEPGLKHEQMVGLVTAFYRDKKQIKTSALSYQIYCRVWYYSRPVRHFWQRGVSWLKSHIRKM